MPPLELTIVLAATRDMGIGLNGTLPWTGLRKEMAYFARVTKRLPPQTPAPALNAVIMGRKTWDSIPPKFRPLKGRLNIVISRSFTSPPPPTLPAPEGPVHAGSLEQALAYLRARRDAGSLGRVFVVGGAQIYGAALAGADGGVVKRVLLTRVLTNFECDTFFPLVLGGENGAEGWARRSHAELDGWVGEEVPEGVQREADTEYEFEMWERVDES